MLFHSASLFAASNNYSAARNNYHNLCLADRSDSHQGTSPYNRFSLNCDTRNQGWCLLSTDAQHINCLEQQKLMSTEVEINRTC